MKMAGTGKWHAAAVATATGGPTQSDVTNATLYNEIKLLRANNKPLSEDVRTWGQWRRTYRPCSTLWGGWGEGAIGWAAELSSWTAPIAVKDQDINAIDAVAAAATCIDETVLNKENKPKTKKKPMKKNTPKKKKKRVAQKKEKIYEETFENEETESKSFQVCQHSSSNSTQTN